MNNTEDQITIKTEWLGELGDIGIVTKVDSDNKLHYYSLSQLALSIRVFTDNKTTSIHKLSDEEVSKYEEWCLKTSD